MLRSSIALAGAAGVCLALTGLVSFSDPAPSAASPTPPVASRQPDLAPSMVPVSPLACEPGSPLQVTLLQSEGVSAGRAELSFEIRPQAEVQDLRWEWVLPQGLIVLEGARSGSAVVEAELGAESGVELTSSLRDVGEQVGALSVDLPHDGIGRGVMLRVSAFIEGSNELGETWLEPVVEERTAMFGEPTSSARPVVSRDLESAEPVRLWAVPARHRAGR
ncbi:MAG: hypothetical protein DHS20C15_07720 [Planctomycetota bacterium]|nr:MAG: hypothetical protein DHS20C15_07720 [Planctomycetota bacterium]